MTAVGTTWKAALVSDQRGPLVTRKEPAGDIVTVLEAWGPCRMTSALDDPHHWYARAEEARVLAEQMVDPEARRIMFGIAKSYELIAQRLCSVEGAAVQRLTGTNFLANSMMTTVESTAQTAIFRPTEAACGANQPSCGNELAIVSLTASP